MTKKPFQVGCLTIVFATAVAAAVFALLSHFALDVLNGATFFAMIMVSFNVALWCVVVVIGKKRRIWNELPNLVMGNFFLPSAITAFFHFHAKIAGVLAFLEVAAIGVSGTLIVFFAAWLAEKFDPQTSDSDVSPKPKNRLIDLGIFAVVSSFGALVIALVRHDFFPGVGVVVAILAGLLAYNLLTFLLIILAGKIRYTIEMLPRIVNGNILVPLIYYSFLGFEVHTIEQFLTFVSIFVVSIFFIWLEWRAGRLQLMKANDEKDD